MQKPWSRLSSVVWPVVLPALVTLLLYLPSLRGEFVWDDPLYLVETPVYRLPDGWRTALVRPFVLSPNYYRPLPLLTFVAQLRLGGFDPLPFHLFNLLLHALNVLLITLLARRLLGRRAAWAWLAAGLAYGLHPALVETAAFVSGRFDLMMTTFCLLALLADLHWRDRRWLRPLLVGLAFLAAALSKEMAVALPLLLPAFHLATDRAEGAPLWKRVWAGWRVYAALLLAGLLYLLIRWAALGALYQRGEGNPLEVGAPAQHLLLILQSLGEYALVTLWPFTTLSPIHYGPLPVTAETMHLGVVILGLLALAGAGLALRFAPRLGWLIVAALLAMLPVLNILPLELGGGAFIAERFLTLPLILLALGLGMSLERVGDRRLVYGGAVLWLLASAVVVELTIPHWRSEMALWRWAVERAPESALPYTNLSKAVTESGDPEEGLRLADEALARDPRSSTAWTQRGLALFMLGRCEEAEEAFRQALSLDEENPLYWNNLAGALRCQKKLVEAVTILHEEVLPRGLDLGYLSLGLVYLEADRPDLAAQYLSEAVRRLPPPYAAESQRLLERTREPERWLRFGDLALSNGDAAIALQAYQEAERLGAGPLDARLGQAAALEALGRWAEAESLLRSLLSQTQDDPRLFYLLGLAVNDQGRRDEACTFFARAVQLAPDWNEPQEMMRRAGCR